MPSPTLILPGPIPLPKPSKSPLRGFSNIDENNEKSMEIPQDPPGAPTGAPQGDHWESGGLAGWPAGQLRVGPPAGWRDGWLALIDSKEEVRQNPALNKALTHPNRKLI